MSTPLISICVPVYNVEKYLRECLDSIINQTLCNIEIICVNDGSTDSSLDILKSYKIKDSRIKLISFDTNRSLLQARKVAVEVATAPFIMFVDSDDSLELDACEKLYSYIKEYDVDILHFGTFVDATSEVRSDVVKWYEDFAEPYPQRVYDDDILTYCFKDRKIIWNLWNKIYRTDIAQKAYSNIGDLYLNMCEDMYAFFLIAYYSKTYFGISQKFYHYRYGAGITGRRLVWDEKKFNDLCQMAYIVPLLEKVVCFREKRKCYSELLEKINTIFSNSALSGLINLSSEADKIRCIGLYINRFGEKIAYDCIVTCLNNQEEAISSLSNQLRERELVVFDLDNKLKEVSREVIKLKGDLEALNEHVNVIKNTRGYKLLEFLRMIKRKLTFK